MMKEATTIRHLNVPYKGLFNRPCSLLYSYLSPEQKQIVAVSRRKLSHQAKTARGKLAPPHTTETSTSRTQVSTMLLAPLWSLKFDRQKNHKNSLLALSSYIFFFTYLFERPTPLETVKFRDLR